MVVEPDELQNLRSLNHLLSAELDALRNFLRGLTQLMAAVDDARYESEVKALLGRMLEELVIATGALDGSLLAHDQETNELVFVLVAGENPNNALLGKRLPPNQGIGAWVMANVKSVIVNNARIDERFYGEVDLELGYRTRSLLAAPLLGGGRVLGVVEVLNKRDGEFFSTGNQALLNLMCRFAGELLYSMVRDLDLTREDFRLLKPANSGEGGYG